MSSEPDTPASDAGRRLEPFLIQAGNVHILPVCHYRLEFAQLVVEAVRRLEPDAIAVEIPSALKVAFVAAVERLPFLSVITYAPTRNERSSDRGYLLVEPADPNVEAARLGRARGISVACVDANLFDYPEYHDGLPDSYAVHRIGHRAYFEAAETERFTRDEPGAEDQAREAMAAHRLRELGTEHQRVLYVCGMAHATRVAHRIDEGQTAFGHRGTAAAIHR